MTKLLGDCQDDFRRAVEFEQEIPDSDGIAKFRLRTRLLIIGGLSAFLWTAIVLGLKALINLAT
ncbi:hypothetical protein IP81_01650 [Novosphingobium sp. AAP83]|uniref:hypothetical protein n=1 Tax=Novosphingobium sp. AAP83 TaxID=1523425 RepID=UPI0006B8A7B4|nr:hypothetical protein [Novosphingobium sp. AAP83]KPF93866.1 hypothetical protein IP81_01650 [Novosphingobium sp. AAP83]